VHRKARLGTNNYKGAQKYKITRKHIKQTYRVDKSNATAPRVLFK